MTDEEKRYREALESIYADARYVWDGSLADGTPIRRGYCQWCGAPPPEDGRDHDIACPASKASLALNPPAEGEWLRVAEFLERKSR